MRLQKILLGMLLLISNLLLNAAVPPIINYQGKLSAADGAPLADGAYPITFAIYAAPTGGTALWSEPYTAVQVKGGLFNVLLGSVVNLPANIFDAPDRFFGVKVGADAEMVPRQPITSVPFALKAEVADMATVANTVADGAITSSKLGQIAAITKGYNPHGEITIDATSHVITEVKITIPSAGKVLALVNVTFQPASIQWVGMRGSAIQNAYDIPTGASQYAGSDGSFYINLSYSTIYSLPADGEWTISIQADTEGGKVVKVHNYSVTLIYLGQ